MYLKYVKVTDVKTPTRAHPTDAGVDFFIPNNNTIYSSPD